MLESIRSFFLKNHKFFYLGISALLLFFLDADISLAAGATDAANKVVITTNTLFRAVAGLMAILTAFVSLFLQPEWVNGTVINLDIYMKKIWILVSNFVYFIFAFLLIFIAFANIIGKGQEKFGLKQALPKFIVGVLIVPFSWFMVQFMVSLAGVLTVGALSLPYDLFKDDTAFKVFTAEGITGSDICVKFVVNLGDSTSDRVASRMVERAGAGSEVVSSNTLGEGIYCKDGGRMKVINILNGTGESGDQSSSVYNIISIYTFGILGIETIDNLDGEAITGGFISTITSLAMKVGFNLIFIVVYLLLMIALFLALFVRIMRTWIYIMLSPLFGLVYFFGSSGGDSVLSKFSFKNFIGLVMLPVYVGLALSFGLVFLMVATHGLQEKSLLNKDGNQVAETTDKVIPLIIGAIELEMIGTINNTGAKTDLGLANAFNGRMKAFKGSGGALGELIIMLFGIGVLWICVMAALKSSELTKSIVQPIADFGSQVGKLAASAPMYAPIIPDMKGGMTSVGAITKSADIMVGDIKNIKNTQASDLLEGMNWMGRGPATAITNSSNLAANSHLDKEKVDHLANAVGKATSIAHLKDNEAFIQALNSLKIEGADDFKSNMSNSEFQTKIATVEEVLDNSANTQYGTGGLFKGLNAKSGQKENIASGLEKILRDNNNGIKSGEVSNADQSSDQATQKIVGGINITNITNAVNDRKNNEGLKGNSHAIALAKEIQSQKTIKSIQEIDEYLLEKGFKKRETDDVRKALMELEENKAKILKNITEDGVTRSQ